MSRKRRNTSSAEPDSPPNRHAQVASTGELEPDEDSDQYEEPQIDAKTGLAGAFPGLKRNNDLFYGPAHDGLDYLRMVRSEASGIPLYLTAPRTSETYDARDDISKGFYDQDEAFIAAPLQDQRLDESEKAQRSYYKSLLEQFHVTQKRLKSTPPLSAIQSLPASTPISFPTSSKPAQLMWETYIQQHIPHPVQIACMDSDSVLEIIRLLTRKMRRFVQPSHDTGVDRIGAWVWAVLARCPDRGQLGGEEISDLRAFAKAADVTWHWLNARVNSPASGTHAREEDTEIGREMVQDAEAASSDDDLSMHKLDVPEDVMKTNSFDLHKHRIILDIIVTVVGETYGQRDLLALRHPWTSGDGV